MIIEPISNPMECGDASPLSVRDTRLSNGEKKAAASRRTPYGLATVCCLLLAVAHHADAQEEEQTETLEAMLLRLVQHERRKADQEATQYQIVSSTFEGGPPTLYAIHQSTGEVAQWNGSQNKWVPVFNRVSPLDWDDIRRQQNEDDARRVRHEAIRDDFWKTLPQKPLEELVAMADGIYVLRYEPFGGEPLGNRITPHAECLKRDGKPVDKSLPFIANVVDNISPPVNKKGGEVLVQFNGQLKGWDEGYKIPGFRTSARQRNNGRVHFYLSHSSPDNETIFPAPETIVEDVKAEIKRQAEEQD